MSITWFHLWIVALIVTPLPWALGLFGSLPTLVCLAVLLMLFAWGICDLRTQFFMRTYWRGDRHTRQVALTFDDGPDPAITGDILDILAKHEIAATFFVVGTNCEQHPDLVKRAQREGHTIACHDLFHSNLSNFRLARKAMREIELSLDIVERIIGRRPKLYRPPVGLMNPRIAAALTHLDLACIGWSRRGHESGNRRIRGIRRISRLGGPGDVVLLHDTVPVPAYKDMIVEQIDQLCGRIRVSGLEMVGVDKLFQLDAYED